MPINFLPEKLFTNQGGDRFAPKIKNIEHEGDATQIEIIQESYSSALNKR